MISDDIYFELLEIVSEVGARPDLGSGADAFFEGIVSSFEGTREALLAYVKDNLRVWFRCVSKYPEWYQSEDWQYSNGRPMLYLGHVDMPARSGPFDQDSRFFLFWDSENGETKTVMQSM